MGSVTEDWELIVKGITKSEKKTVERKDSEEKAE